MVQGHERRVDRILVEEAAYVVAHKCHAVDHAREVVECSPMKLAVARNRLAGEALR